MNRIQSIATVILTLLVLPDPAVAQPGDAARGERTYRACVACHSLEPNRNMTGPSLAEVRIGNPDPCRAFRQTRLKFSYRSQFHLTVSNLSRLRSWSGTYQPHMARSAVRQCHCLLSVLAKSRPAANPSPGRDTPICGMGFKLRDTSPRWHGSVGHDARPTLSVRVVASPGPSDPRSTAVGAPYVAQDRLALNG